MFDTISSDFVAVRLRKENNKILFTIKKNVTGELDSMESEVEISDFETMDSALKMMGYIPLLSIHKERKTYTKDTYEICLDEVKDLGTFIEIETFVDMEEDGEEDSRKFILSVEVIWCGRKRL